MRTKRTPAKNIDDYIDAFPPEVQSLLRKLRATIRKAAPKAEERISYQMPAFFLHGPVVFFAGYKKHIGLYPTPTGIANFKQELSGYKGAKGSVQFPLDEPVPFNLIAKIVRFRVQENLAKAAQKTKAR